MLAKYDNGIVSVNAYGVYENIAFPLISTYLSRKERLKESDSYKTKIELASSIVTELVELALISIWY